MNEYEHLKKQTAEIEKKQGLRWVPVTEDLPPRIEGSDYSEWVLLYNGHWRGVGRYNFDADDEYDRWEDERTEYISPAITHWRTLPTAPTEEERS